MVRRSPADIVSAARGDFKEKFIAETGDVGVFDKPLVEYLDADETLEYLFRHQYKGLRIFDTDGGERTPHHEMGTSGQRFFLVTDRRVLYVAGTDTGDDVRVFSYDEITDVDANWGWTHGRINITTADGTEYKFADSGTYASQIEDAGEYIATRIENANTPSVGEEDPEPDSIQEPDPGTGDTKVFDGDSDGDGAFTAETGAGDTKVFAGPETPAPADVTCPNCGEEGLSDAKFCMYCGEELAACSSCGAILPADANFCAECGSALD